MARPLLVRPARGGVAVERLRAPVHDAALDSTSDGGAREGQGFNDGSRIEAPRAGRSAGRSLSWHGRGRGFKSHPVHTRYGSERLSFGRRLPLLMPRRGEGRWHELLEDPDVKRWYDNLARGSNATADNYYRVLGRFLAANDLTAKGFLRLRSTQRENLVADHISALLNVNKAASYVEVTKKAVSSWLDWNGMKMVRKIRIPGAGRRPSLREAHIPSQEELRQVLNIADARARTATALIAFSGLRPEALGTYRGDDGLRLRDFVEAKVTQNQLICKPVPTKIEVPERLSKTGRAYFTFLGSEGCEYLNAYLRERAEAGETITGASPLITPRKVDKPFMRTINIGDLLRKPMRAAGLKEPPYIWRSYFASRAMLAESRGFSRDYRLFVMGHKGDIQHVYSLHKKIPPDAVESIRRGYRAALDLIQTTKSVDRENEIKILFSREMLVLAGLSEGELDGMDVDSLSDA